MHKFVLILVAVAAIGVSACSSKAKVREPAKLQDIVNASVKPKTLWSSSAGSGSGKMFSGLRLNLEVDALYAADTKGNVYAYNAATGKQIWRTDAQARLISGPTVSGDMILLGTLDADVIALKRADGSELWRRRISSEVMAPPVSDGKIVVARAVDGRVWGLSAADGEWRWTFDRQVPNLVLRGSSEPLLVGGLAIVGMDNGRVVGLKLENGQPAWEQPISVPSGRTELERLTDIDADLLDGPDCVYVASFGGEIACTTTISGEVSWRRTVKTYNSLAIGADKVYVSDESGVVWALDAKTGAAAWKQEGLLYRKLSPPAYYNGYVVVGDYQGYLHWMDPSDGKIIARTRDGSDPIVSAPIAGENALYVTNRSGRIAAIAAAAR